MYIIQRNLFRLLLYALCAALLLSVMTSLTARADSNPITITAQSDTVTFPSIIDFSLTARDTSASISQATLFITFDSQNTMFYPGTSGYEERHDVTIAAGRTISTHWQEDISGNNFHIPGTHFAYFWVLQDSTGSQFSGIPQRFTLIDTRFSWQSLTQGFLNVHWYNRSLDFGKTMLNHASTSVEHISQLLGGHPNQPIDVWVYETAEDFKGSLPPSTYEWVGGIAFPILNETFIVSNGADDVLVRDMPHELTHLIFHQLTAQGIIAPRWFDEGLAVYGQEYRESELQQRLNQGIATNSLLPLDSISTNFPADSNQAYLAYAQSWSLIDYMYRTFGHDKMALFIQKMNNSKADFIQDLKQALGITQVQLESQWRASLLHSSQSNPVQPHAKPTGLDFGNLSTLILAVLLILAAMAWLVVLVGHRRLKPVAVSEPGRIITENPPPLVNQAPPSLDAQPVPYIQPRPSGDLDYPDADGYDY